MEPPEDGVEQEATQESVTSSSSASRRSISTRRSSKIQRLGSLKVSSNSSLRPGEPPSASDDQSLTSFPSLSPSLDNSPELLHGKTHDAIASAQEQGEDDEDETTPSKQPKVVPESFRHLFTLAPEQNDRSTLFFDGSQDVRDIPGTLHLQSDQHVQHLLSRVGAVKLVKRLARDLAQRDAHVTLVQRKAEERERVLRRMLIACEVSNLDIETRLKELDVDRAQSSGSGSVGPALIVRAEELGSRADASMDERIGEALTDGLDDGPFLDVPSVGDNIDRTLRASALAGQSGSTNDVRTSRGWTSLFRGGTGTTRSTSRTGSGSNVAASGQRKPSVASERSQASNLAADLSPTISRTTSRTPSLQAPKFNRTRNSSGAGSESGASTNSVASWALRIVAGGTQSGRTKERAVTVSGGDDRSAATAKLTSTVRRAAKDSNATIRNMEPTSLKSPRPSFTTGYGPHGTLRTVPLANSHQSITGILPTHSPQPSVDGTATNLGPVEMDTILPEDTRPPTLTQQARTSSSEFLTDNFGFIYDQRRRRKFNHAAATALAQKKRGGDKVETLKHHRMRDDHPDIDDIAPDTQSSGEHPSSDDPGAMEPTKRWQDYLKLSNYKTELLLHSPAPAPITDITTGEPELATSAGQAAISMSTRGSVPALGKAPEPSTTRVVSDNAELVAPSSSGPTSPGEGRESESDPVKALVEHLSEVHTNAQREKTIKWNEFLRKVRAERRRDVVSKAELDAKSRGSQMPEALLTDGGLIGVAGLGVRGKVGRAKGNEFRNLVLAGIPTAYRAKIWAECSGALSLRIPGYYEELTNSAFTDETIVQQIQMDIPRTLTDNIYYRRGAGVDKLKEVLLAYARRNPEIGYCQGMNLITANLLLIMPTAEDAFWVLTSMVENILPKDYYSPTLLTSRADQVVLRRYVADILPQLSRHLDDLGIELEALTFQWFLSVFTDCLSAEALFRVWDVVLCLSDNSTIGQAGATPVSGTATFLFQVALALLKLNEKSLFACESPADVYRYINRGMTDHAISIDNLIRASEGLRKEVRSEVVVQRRKRAVEEELETMRKRESIRKGKGKAVEPSGAGPANVTVNGTSQSEDAPERTPRAKNGRLTRQSSRAAFEEDDVEQYGELTLRTPMPIDEEAFWRA